MVTAAFPVAKGSDNMFKIDRIVTWTPYETNMAG